jgi:hypothetical protein
VTQSAPPNLALVCSYCGLESSVSHANSRECIDALQSELKRLRNGLAPTDVGQSRSERDHNEAMSPRLGLGL